MLPPFFLFCAIGLGLLLIAYATRSIHLLISMSPLFWDFMILLTLLAHYLLFPDAMFMCPLFGNSMILPTLFACYLCYSSVIIYKSLVRGLYDSANPIYLLSALSNATFMSPLFGAL